MSGEPTERRAASRQRRALDAFVGPRPERARAATPAVWRWSVRRARLMRGAYAALVRLLRLLNPLLTRIGYARLERPAARLESALKGALFGCRMCGQCVLSSTGMSCPMNCPKAMRNGPCGGVRANGNCEVYPDMACVWAQAFDGDQRLGEGAINAIQQPIDFRQRGASSWLAVARGEQGG